MSKPAIPSQVITQVAEIVAAFNRKIIRDPNQYYMTRYRASYLYLDRVSSGRSHQVCRLKYTGDMSKWEFAIFKYSRGTYDPQEWFFPGAGHVDGTVEGAMKAGLEAYP